ncbi:hypothetical protein SDJN02_11127 [Cucurbita argyrosperma subsp. argyrosperma]|nr:hypothetical protein SDJN02_11127 [Cucurbita argyrosperma subsp. argyrosperma]
MCVPFQSLNILCHFPAFNGGNPGAFLLIFNSFLALFFFIRSISKLVLRSIKIKHFCFFLLNED